MSRSFRHRVTPLAALTFLAPLLVFGTAHADPSPVPATESEPVVEFTGGCQPVPCSAKPSTDRPGTPAGSGVTFVDGLGRQASLYLDARAVGPPVVPDGAVAERFNRGPAEVAMGPGVPRGTRPVNVWVVAAPPSSGPSASAPRSASPALTAFAQRRSAVHGVDPGPAAGGSSARDEDLDGAVAPDQADPVPDADRGDAAAEGDSAPDVTAPDATTTINDPAAELLEPVSPVGEGGPTGLLAIIAAVRVAGVLTSITRAIIAQRATRTRAA
jgi:hypothetical protein